MPKNTRVSMFDMPTKEEVEKTGEVWSPSEEDKLLDLYLSGVSTAAIPLRVNRSPKSVTTKLWKICNKYDNIPYIPGKRKTRSPKPLSGRERHLVKLCRKGKMSIKYAARVINRPVDELKSLLQDAKKENKAKVGFFRQVQKTRSVQAMTTGEDMVMAYRFLYYVMNISLIPDQMYDDLEAEVLEFGAYASDSPITKPGSGNKEDYLPHIRSLALYLAYKHGEPSK